MSQNYRKIPKVRVPYVSRLPQFDALEIHYDDEHQKYHVCGANWVPERHKLIYFMIDPDAKYVMIGTVREALKQWIVCDKDGIPVKWEPLA